MAKYRWKEKARRKKKGVWTSYDPTCIQMIGPFTYVADTFGNSNTIVLQPGSYQITSSFTSTPSLPQNTITYNFSAGAASNGYIQI
jgi:hypothetical protein